MAAEDLNGERSPQGVPTGTDQSLDSLARGLADSSVSRRKALRLMGAALIGTTLASIPGFAWAKPKPGRCTKNSQCPSGQRCVNGQCAAQPPEPGTCVPGTQGCWTTDYYGNPTTAPTCGACYATVSGVPPTVCACTGSCAADCNSCPPGTVCAVPNATGSNIANCGVGEVFCAQPPNPPGQQIGPCFTCP